MYRSRPCAYLFVDTSPVLRPPRWAQKRRRRAAPATQESVKRRVCLSLVEQESVDRRRRVCMCGCGRGGGGPWGWSLSCPIPVSQWDEGEWRDMRRGETGENVKSGELRGRR